MDVDQPANFQPASLTFHAKQKGRGVTLSNNQQTAERTGGHCAEGIVLSCEPMEVSCLYQVKVDKTDSLWNNSYIYLGVVTQSPDTVTIPRWPQQPTSGVVIYHDWVKVNGKKRDSKVGSSLREVGKEDSVGLMLDKDRTLHLYANDRHLGEIEPNLPHPCHFMVDLGFCCTKRMMSTLSSQTLLGSLPFTLIFDKMKSEPGKIFTGAYQRPMK